MTMRRTFSTAQIILTIYTTCFSIGFAEHALDFARYGWRPYDWGVLPLEIFWTVLIFLDAMVVGLLLFGWRRSALLAALPIMAMDVGANSYALFVMKKQAFAAPLVMQAVFFGFVAGSVGFLWPESGTGQ